MKSEETAESFDPQGRASDYEHCRQEQRKQREGIEREKEGVRDRGGEKKREEEREE